VNVDRGDDGADDTRESRDRNLADCVKRDAIDSIDDVYHCVQSQTNDLSSTSHYHMRTS
jgi:hypothetical protein